VRLVADVKAGGGCPEGSSVGCVWVSWGVLWVRNPTKSLRGLAKRRGISPRVRRSAKDVPAGAYILRSCLRRCIFPAERPRRGVFPAEPVHRRAGCRKPFGLGMKKGLRIGPSHPNPNDHPILMPP
jgi:hypothetical protein